MGVSWLKQSSRFKFRVPKFSLPETLELSNFAP